MTECPHEWRREPGIYRLDGIGVPPLYVQVWTCTCGEVRLRVTLPDEVAKLEDASHQTMYGHSLPDLEGMEQVG